jgi:hypothetical protein
MLRLWEGMNGGPENYRVAVDGATVEGVRELAIGVAII